MKGNAFPLHFVWSMQITAPPTRSPWISNQIAARSSLWAGDYLRVAWAHRKNESPILDAHASKLSMPHDWEHKCIVRIVLKNCYWLKALFSSYSNTVFDRGISYYGPFTINRLLLPSSAVFFPKPTVGWTLYRSAPCTNLTGPCSLLIGVRSPKLPDSCFLILQLLSAVTCEACMVLYSCLCVLYLVSFVALFCTQDALGNEMIHLSEVFTGGITTRKWTECSMGNKSLILSFRVS